MSEKNPELIGQGTYGCVYSPSLKCKDDIKIDYENKVSKVLSNDEAITEREEYLEIAEADPNSEVYLGVPTLCFPADTAINKNAIRKCDIELEDETLLIMKNGGVNLQQLADEWAKQPITPLLITEVEDFWLETQKLLLGLTMFLENGVIHADLKPQNIVYNKDTKTIAYIDFGMMRPLYKYKNDAMGNNNDIVDEHWSYPWETKFINQSDFIRMASKTKDDKINKVAKKINTSLNEWKKPYNFFINYVVPKKDNMLDGLTNYSQEEKDELIIQKQLEYLDTDYKDFLLNSEPKTYPDFVKKSAETFDLFGVGLSLGYVWKQLAPIILQIKTINIARLNTIIFGMYRPDVYSRYTVEQALTMYEDVLTPLAKSRGLIFVNHRIKPISVIKQTSGTMPASITKPKTITKSKSKMEPISANLQKVKISKIRINKERLNELIQKEDKKLKQRICPDGKIMNLLTGRCVKTCKASQIRNAKFRCVSGKTRKVKSSVSPPPGFQKI